MWRRPRSPYRRCAARLFPESRRGADSFCATWSCALMVGSESALRRLPGDALQRQTVGRAASTFVTFSRDWFNQLCLLDFRRLTKQHVGRMLPQSVAKFLQKRRHALPKRITPRGAGFPACQQITNDRMAISRAIPLLDVRQFRRCLPHAGSRSRIHRRGHDVTFATNIHYAELSQRHGIPFEPLGSEELFKHSCIRHPDLWHPQRAFRHIVQSLQPVLKRAVRASMLPTPRPETLLELRTCLDSRNCSPEKLGLPVLTVHFQPSVMWSDYQPPVIPGLFGPRWLQSILYRFGERFFINPVVCPFLNPWRKELGLPPIRKSRAGGTPRME